MNITITYTQHPERMAYLEQLLAQLRTEFPRQKPALIDGTDTPLFSVVHSAFCQLAEQKGPCLYLQEDTRLTSRFNWKLRRVHRRWHLDVSYLYSARLGTPPYLQLLARGQSKPHRAFRGGECAVYADAEIFRRYAEFCREHPEQLEGRVACHDLFFRDVCCALKLGVRAVMPSLVQHIGGFSAKFGANLPLAPEAKRWSPTFEE